MAVCSSITVLVGCTANLRGVLRNGPRCMRIVTVSYAPNATTRTPVAVAILTLDSRPLRRAPSSANLSTSKRPGRPEPRAARGSPT